MVVAGNYLLCTMEEAQPPNQTLYVHNLNEKVKKFQLKQSLLALFSQFGKVLDIVACRGIRLRGQVREEALIVTDVVIMRGFS